MPRAKYEDLWFPLPPFDYKLIKAAQIRKVMRTFHKRVFHVHNMIEFPSAMIGLAVRDTVIRSKLRTEHVLYGETVEIAPAVFDKAVQEMVKELLVHETQNLEHYEKNRLHSFRLFLDFIRRFKVISEVQGIFIGMIISAWAAIEVTIKELYTASSVVSSVAQANACHPVGPPAVRINQKQLAKRKITMPPNKPNKQVGFTSIGRAREAYSMMFDRDSRLIDAAMSSLDLDALALVRNLFVHNALIPDKNFRDRGQNIPALKRFMSPTCKLVKINGRFTRLLVHRAFKATDKLILAVDKWAQKHP